MNMNIQISTPSSFTAKQVIVENLMSLLPQIVFGASIGFGFVAFPADMFFLLYYGKSLFGVLIPVCSLIIGLSFLFYAPLALMMNFYIKSIVKKAGLSFNESNEYASQISLKPRLHGGLWGVLEDADDVGVLRIDENQVSFTGDHINLCFAFSTIESVEKRNVGYRGFWLVGKRIRIYLKDTNEYRQIEFLERQSTTLIEAKRISINVFTLIAEKI
jgi:hypothetical protein